MDKPNLFLDLDNTLLSAVPIEEIKWTDQNRELACEFPFYNMEDYYIVFERPGLQEFLDFIFENFNVSIWSAASKDYVLFIVDNIIKTKPGRDLKYIMFSYHCDKCKKSKKGSIKLLDFLWDKYNLPGITKENTFIIDDNERVVKHNIGNVIHIKEFEFEDGPVCKEDRELYNIIPHMQRILEDYHSMRRVDPVALEEASSVEGGPLTKSRYRFQSPDQTSKVASPTHTPEDMKISSPPDSVSNKIPGSSDKTHTEDSKELDIAPRNLLDSFDDESDSEENKEDHKEADTSPHEAQDTKSEK